VTKKSGLPFPQVLNQGSHIGTENMPLHPAPKWPLSIHQNLLPSTAKGTLQR
jgi:hypothetical protein